jgi:hypothetical protein
MALEHVTPKGAFPWATRPTKYAPPRQKLVLWSDRLEPVGSDFRLIWDFSFWGTGVDEPGTMTLDAKDGTLLETTPGKIR